MENDFATGNAGGMVSAHPKLNTSLKINNRTLKMMVWKMIFLFNWVTLGSMLTFRVYIL